MGWNSDQGADSPPPNDEASPTENDAVRFFLPGIAHEIGNALQAAGLELDLLRASRSTSDLLPVAVEKHIDALNRQLDAIKRLNGAVLDVARSEYGAKGSFPLDDLLAQISLCCGAALRHRGVRLVVADDQASLSVDGSLGAALRMCISELRTATRSLANGGLVVVDTRRLDESHVSIEIGAHPQDTRPPAAMPHASTTAQESTGIARHSVLLNIATR
ncbi:MAG: hypothetical protein U1E83_03585 [Methylotetracoccus sp.]